MLLTKVNPLYPQEAKDQHLQGTVILQVIVDKEGNAANVQAHQRTRHAGPGRD